MTFSNIHQEEAPHVGEPEDTSIQKLAGIAPPCEECGKQESLPGDF